MVLSLSLPFTFHKDERLKSQKLIQLLFNEGMSHTAYPIRFIFLPTSFESTFPAKVCIAASKRKLPRAVDRNQMKRRLREAYRLHKHLLYPFLEQHSIQLSMMLLYNSSELKSYSLIEEATINGIEKIISKLDPNNQPT